MNDDKNHYARGFLSTVVGNIREEVRQKYAAWIAIFDDVNILSVEYQHTIQIDPTDPTELYGAALFARTIASTQGAVILLEHGMLPQARAVLRTALETLFPLCAIVQKPQLTTKFLASHDADKRTVADRMLKWKDPNLRAAVTDSTSPAELDGYLASKAKKLNVHDIAVEADMEDWYLTHYMLLSFSAHSAVHDLASHLVRDTQGLIVALKNEPEVDNQLATWTFAIEIQLKALHSLSGLFKLDVTRVEMLKAKFKIAIDATEGRTA